MDDKTLTIKSVFENADKMAKWNRKMGEAIKYKNLIWKMSLSRDENNNCWFSVECATTQEEETVEKWLVDAECEFRLIGNKVHTQKAEHRFDDRWDGEYMVGMPEPQIDQYMIDGNLTVEFHVKILKAQGVKEIKSKFDGESIGKVTDAVVDDQKFDVSKATMSTISTSPTNIGDESTSPPLSHEALIKMLTISRKSAQPRHSSATWKTNYVVLVVEEKRFYVNKTNLASRSAYFESLLIGQFEAQSEVVLHGIEANDFQHFLDVLYHGAPFNNQNVESVLKVGDMYGGECLLKQAEEFLTRNSMKSKKEKFELAVKYNIENLKEAMLSLGQSQCSNVNAILPEDLTQFDHTFPAKVCQKCIAVTSRCPYLFRISAVNVHNKKIDFDVHSTDTILSLKSRILVREGIPPDRQCLKFGGKVLEDKKTIADYKIERNAVLDLWIIFPD